MATANYKKPNPNLERLIALLGIAKPSHGYTVAETAPEVVTAPGVYFPAENGKVIPLRPPPIPGLPKAPTGRSYSMLPEASKLGGSNFLWQDKYTPRQSGGTVAPTLLEMEKKQGGGWGQADIGIDEDTNPPQPTSAPPPQPVSTPPPKKEPDIIDKLVEFLRPTLKLYSRQMGGEVTPLTGMAEYEANARKMRGLPALAPGESAPTGMAAYEEAGQHMRGLLPTTQTNQTSLSPFTPPPFKENTRSPIFGSDQEIAYNKKWQDFSRLFSRQGGGSVWPPTPESLELAEREKWAVPGYAEKRLAEERAKEGTISLKGGPSILPVIGVFPGYERTYYEAHPEERMMELIAEQNKPTTDAMQKALEEARTKSQGFGLMGLTPKRAAAERLQASKDVASLTQALTQATAREEATGPQYLKAMEPTPTKPFTPHLVQTSTGEYVWATPGGVLPAGIMGKTTPEEQNEYRDFMRHAKSPKEQGGLGLSEDEALKAWDKMQINRTQQKAGATIQGQQEAVIRNISEDAWQQAVESYMTKGVIPFEFSRMAYRYPLVATEIYRRAREKGFTGTEAGVREAAYKGLTTEYQTTAKRKAATLYFENMLKQNTDLLEQENLKVLRTKYPAVNNIKLWMQHNAGNPDVVAFKTQLGRVAVEWAKLTSGSLGMAEVSVQAQRNMDALLNASTNIDQLKALLQTIRADAGHAANSIYNREAEQRKEIYEMTNTTPPVERPKYKKVKIKIGDMDVTTDVPIELTGSIKGESVGKGQGTPQAARKEIIINGKRIIEED
jgi:hypothetical protein